MRKLRLREIVTCPRAIASEWQNSDLFQHSKPVLLSITLVQEEEKKGGKDKGRKEIKMVLQDFRWHRPISLKRSGMSTMTKKVVFELGLQDGWARSGLVEMQSSLLRRQGQVKHREAFSYLISEMWGREEPIELFFPGGSEVRGGPRVEGTEAVEKGPGLRRTSKIELVITDAEGQGLG